MIIEDPLTNSMEVTDITTVLEEGTTFFFTSKRFLGSQQGLWITSMPQGRFVYWKGMEPSGLLDTNACLVATL